MESSIKISPVVTERQVVSARIFNTRRDLVFKAWAEPEYLSQWWGPNGFTNTFEKFDFSEGGKWQFIMHGPDGKEYPNESTFEKIKAPERIVLTHMNPPHFRATFTFDDLGEQTKVTFTQLFDSTDIFNKIKHIVVPANEENFDRLDVQLGKLSAKHNFSISCTINAPHELVFKAWTEPEHLVHWWGPKGLFLGIKQFELTPGGMFHYSMQLPDGSKMYGRFIYQDIQASSRLVFINSFADENGKITRAPFSPTWPLEMYNVLTLTEQNDQTLLTLTGWPINANEQEKQTYEQGFDSMKQGFGSTFNELVAYLSTMQA